MIRRAQHSDLATIMQIVRSAQLALSELHIDQWQDGYPTRDNIALDIERGVGYVATDPSDNPIGYAAILLSEEPAYRQIADSRWNTPNDYVVVHRLCVRSEARRLGVAQQLMEYAMRHAETEGIRAFRIDTHEGNIRMLSMLHKLGFEPRGIVRYESGQRIAYDLNIKDKD